MLLPDSLARLQAVRAKLEEGKLRVRLDEKQA
ncbi:hypothetical protein [Rubrobacter taiwanensis]